VKTEVSGIVGAMLEHLGSGRVSATQANNCNEGESLENYRHPEFTALHTIEPKNTAAVDATP
jgi:hypothetical protein